MAKTEQPHSGVEPTKETDCAVLRRAGHRRGPQLAPRIPNAETIAALREPADKLKQFELVDDLFADIETGPGASITGEIRTVEPPA